jgi:hypothetical protein
MPSRLRVIIDYTKKSLLLYGVLDCFILEVQNLSSNTAEALSEARKFLYQDPLDEDAKAILR